MILELLIAIFLGIILGIFTGLIPGVHVNLVAILMIGSAPVLSRFFSPLQIAVLIISTATVHTFLDSIPSIFLGAPDSANVLNVLPGHRMLLEGNGYGAVKLTVIGSIISLIITVCLIPLLIPVIPPLYDFIKPYIGFILIGVVVFMILKEKKPRKILIATFIFLASGSLGLIVLNFNGLAQPLLPMLSGMFGISTMLLSLNDKVNIPVQSFTKKVFISTKNYIKAFSGAVFSGSLTGIFPGLGAASAALISMSIVGDIGNYAFLVMIGGINTVNFVFSIATLYSIEKARNGAIVAVQELVGSIGISELFIILGCILFVGGIAAILALNFSKIFSRIMSKLNYKLICLSIISLILLLSFFFSGVIGLLVLFVSTSIGLIAPLMGVKRSNAMGCLLLPVILFFVL